MNAAPRRTDAGFSLVEVMIATTVVLVAIWASIGAQSYVTGMMNETVARSQLQEAAQFGLKEIAHDTRWCDSTALILSTANSSSRVDVRTPVDYVAGAPVWSGTITYEVVASPNDVNENGVSDDWRLVRTENGAVRVLCDGVAVGGFTATRVGTQVTLQLNAVRTYGGRQLTAAATKITILRNGV